MINFLIDNWKYFAAGVVVLLLYHGEIWTGLKAAVSFVRRERSVAQTITAEDDRAELNVALCKLADRAAQTKCVKLRATQDEAITELSKMIPRQREYEPSTDANVELPNA
jgi:hypothetical protein